jgi:hypothetical protein
MVNLVVRTSSPSLKRHQQAAKPSINDRAAPIHMLSPSEDARPISPLTTTESIFHGGHIDAPMIRGEPEQRDHPGIGRAPNAAAQQEESICDYDKNVTELYQLLEANNWDRARIRARSVPREVRTWIVRRDGETGKVRWKLLPLHAAVIFQAPLPIIKAMLDVYPKASSQCDDQGMLPLHLAFRHKQQDETLLEILLEQYPRAVSIKDRRDRLPIEHGADLQFSSKLMHLYAQAYSACIASESNSVTSSKAESIKRTYQTQIEAMRVMYEERIATITTKHKQTVQELKNEMREKEQKTREHHDLELDELRELLSRHVGSGRQVESEVEELKAQLADSNAKVVRINQDLQESKHHNADLIESYQKIIEDQRTLHTFCSQQHLRLQDAQKMRDQMLKTLLRNENDPKILRSSSEMCEISDNIQVRMQRLMSAENATREQGQRAAFVPLSSYDDEPGTDSAPAKKEPDASGWGLDHDDEISAITELSNFR